jgi:hypothetical protein
VLRSEAPLAEQQSRIYLAGTVPPLHPHDYVFISDTWNSIDMNTVNPRVRSLANDGRAGWHWKLSDPAWKLDLVPHPTPVPDTMIEPGKTCLEVQASTGENDMWQYTFIGTEIQGEALWYGQLEPGKQYRLEIWLRQVGLAPVGTGNSGQVKFSFREGYPGLETVFDVTDAWKKYTFDFTGPDRPTNQWHFGPTFTVKGPGTFWMDNALIFRYESPTDIEHPYIPGQTPLAELIDSQPEQGKKGSLRVYGALFNQATMDSLLSYHASSQANINWNCSVDGSTAMTLPMALEFLMATGSSATTRMRPWLTLQVYFTEQEWLDLIEYLAAPYDPGKDTPTSKPYAWRRTQQRGINTPWVDEFDGMIIEFGNESWHNGAGGYGFIGFGPPEAVWQGGHEYGLFARRFINHVKTNSPYWASQNLAGKIKFSLNGGYEATWDNSSDGTDWYGETAIQQASSASLLSHATYVGPKWETGDTSPSSFDDNGLQETLVGYLTGNRDYYNRLFQTRNLLENNGFSYDLGAYEGGPSGYAIPGQNSPEASEAGENYGKSLAMAVAALDAWLNAYHTGWTEQMFFNYGQGTHWSSHNLFFQGFLPTPGWLALKMRNHYLKGDLMQVTEQSMPTYQRPGTEIQELPLIGCHAFYTPGQWSVVVYSRKLDGNHSGSDFGNGVTPVTLTLPIESAESITLNKLTGNPRDNNRVTEKIQIQTETIPVDCLNPDEHTLVINEQSGGVGGGIPAGSIFMYVITEAKAGFLAPLWHLY